MHNCGAATEATTHYLGVAELFQFKERNSLMVYIN